MSYKETAELMRETEQRIIKDVLDDLREVMGWSKNELPFDSETNIRLKRKEKKWEARRK
ncbi:hypothetical protein LCGC14_0371720 [marine sediment metagenome]|uniref:Uncharacterized protein n=1 Tax=marine sediment metagenome TaxID=412755 RepID=A0A0F9T559_9ZZZZ